MAFLTAAEALRWALEIEKNGEAFYNAVAAKSAAIFDDEVPIFLTVTA
jgi:rubrerythrin